VLAAIAGVVAIGLFTKNQAEISQERKQFLAAQKEVNELGAKLAKATNPDKHEAVAYCDYGHVKYGKGGRTCWVNYYQTNRATTKENALKIMTKIENVIKGTRYYEARDTNSLNSIQTLKYKSNGLNCGTTLYFKHEDNLAYDDGVLQWAIPNESATIVTSCSGEAKAEHFPVKE